MTKDKNVGWHHSNLVVMRTTRRSSYPILPPWNRAVTELITGFTMNYCSIKLHFTLIALLKTSALQAKVANINIKRGQSNGCWNMMPFILFIRNINWVMGKIFIHCITGFLIVKLCFYRGNIALLISTCLKTNLTSFKIKMTVAASNKTDDFWVKTHPKNKTSLLLLDSQTYYL